MNREQIIKAQNEIKNAQAERDKEINRKKEIFYTERRNLQKAINEIEQSIRDREDIMLNEIQTIEENCAEQTKPHNETLAHKRFLLDCMEINKEESDLHFEVYFYDRQREKRAYDSIATLYKDEYCIINAYIVENDRPKNCFSLAIVGKNRLQRLMNDKNFAYSTSFCETGANVCIELAFKPTSNEVLDHYKKNNKIILRDYLQEYKEKKVLYEQAIRKTATPEWTRIYLEDKKYYYEHFYSRGEETPEYAKIIKQLKELGFIEEPEEPEQKKFYFPVKLVGYGKDEEQAWEDAVDGFSSEPGPMDEFKEADELEEE